MNRFLVNTILIFSAIAANAQGDGIQFVHSWKEASAQAAKENKIIFMDAYTTWCGPCKMLTKNVFPDQSVGAFFNKNFVNLKMDMEKGEGIELASAYNVSAYPTLLFLESNGNLVHRSVGYHNIEQFLALGKTALDPTKRLGALDKMYRDGKRDPEFLMQYAMLRYEAMDGSHAPVAEDYLATQNDWNSELNTKFIFRMVDNVDSKMFAHLTKNRANFDAIFGEQEVTGRIEQIIYSSIYGLGPDADLKAVDAIFAKAYPAKAAQFSARYRMRYNLEKEDMDGYAKAAVDYFKKFPSNDASELNNEAWMFYEVVEKKSLLKKAVKWAQKSVELENAYYNNDTLAALYQKLGKKKKALAAAENALAIAKTTGEDYAELEQRIEAIKAMK